MEHNATHWIQQRPDPMPICARNDSSASESLKGLLSNYKELLGSNKEAMLWLRIGLIERPHDIVQSATKGTAAYIHGIVHRLEGDYWNANYWFRRVGDPTMLNKISSAVTQEGIVHSFDPTEFTNQVESWSRSKDSNKLAKLEQIATLEWEALWALL